MRLIASALASALLLAGTFAQAETTTYRGEGKFHPRPGAGDVYEYRDLTTVEPLSDVTSKVSSAYTFSRSEGGREETMQITYYTVKGEDIYFNVLDSAQERVGDGYCFEEGDRKTCSMSLEMNGVRIEESRMESGNDRYVQGSMRNANGFIGAYKSHLVHVESGR